MMLAFRAPMRSRDDETPVGIAVERALALGLCGIGGRLDDEPGSLADALAAVDARFGERAARRLERFAAAPDGAFVWTRDVDGNAWLGRLAGAWRYDPASAARDADLVHVRPCAWLSGPIAPAEVPSRVHATFARGGRNWQRIRDDDATRLSGAIWERRRGG